MTCMRQRERVRGRSQAKGSGMIRSAGVRGGVVQGQTSQSRQVETRAGRCPVTSSAICDVRKGMSYMEKFWSMVNEVAGRTSDKERYPVEAFCDPESSNTSPSVENVCDSFNNFFPSVEPLYHIINCSIRKGDSSIRLKLPKSFPFISQVLNQQ
ncbi:hypothetical protein J6590_099399 [Homalodisca vitripennis]|nr:hypothetical protein J6590_099399 [Homalodisca vitripennis]